MVERRTVDAEAVGSTPIRHPTNFAKSPILRAFLLTIFFKIARHCADMDIKLTMSVHFKDMIIRTPL